MVMIKSLSFFWNRRLGFFVYHHSIQKTIEILNRPFSAMEINENLTSLRPICMLVISNCFMHLFIRIIQPIHTYLGPLEHIFSYLVRNVFLDYFWHEFDTQIHNLLHECTLVFVVLDHLGSGIGWGLIIEVVELILGEDDEFGQGGDW